MPIDLEAIERALEKCEKTEGDNLDCGDSSDHDRYVTTRALWVDACEDLAMRHGPDLLRLVRAILWMEEHKAELVMWGDDWVCEGIPWEDVPYTGPAIIDAIEAAMEASDA